MILRRVMNRPVAVIDKINVTFLDYRHFESNSSMTSYSFSCKSRKVQTKRKTLL